MAIRVLHATYQRYYVPGIVRQLEYEQRAAQKLQIPWRSCLFMPSDAHCDSEVIVKGNISARDRAGSKSEYYKWLRDASGDCDLVLLRHSFGDFRELQFLRTADHAVFLTHHTLEEHEILSVRTLKARLKWIAEVAIGPICIRHAAGIIAATNEIASYEKARSGNHKHALIYPNGIEIVSGRQLLDNKNFPAPSFAFVASHFAPWHGLDRLVKSAQSCKEEFACHVIGEVPAIYHDLSLSDRRFVLHGLLPKPDVSRTVSQCQIGLGSFALDRKKMSEACTLKTREYLANGIPVYSGHVDIFPREFPYYRVGAPDVRHIVEMSREAMKWRRNDVVNAAMPYIDKSILLGNLYRNLTQILEK